jgi:exonuclease SbcC
VRLNQIALTNFRQHTSTKISFDLGLTGIIGPNGSGKTTILEAIAFALYGARALRLTKETVRFQRAGPRAHVEVELDFELAGHRYRVVRELNSAAVYLDGGETALAVGTEPVNEFLLRRLGMSREEFHRTYFTGQRELGVMTALQPAQRAEFLARVLGHDRLQRAQERARQERNRLREKSEALASGLPDPSLVAQRLETAEKRYREAALRAAEAAREHAAAEAVLAELRPLWEQAQYSRDAARRVEGELRVARSEAASLRDRLTRLDEELEAVALASSELERLRVELAPLTVVERELESLEALARAEGRRLGLERTLQGLARDIQGIEQRRQPLLSVAAQVDGLRASLAAARTSLEETSATLEQQRTDWVRDRQEVETKRDQLRRQYQELKEQYERLIALGEEGPCPVCTRPLGSSYSAVLSGIKEQMETLVVDGRYYSNRLEQLQSPPAEVQELEAERKRLAAKLPVLERELAQAEAAARELNRLQSEVSSKQAQLAELHVELASIPAGYDPSRHRDLQRQREQLTQLAQRAARLGAAVEREPGLREERDRIAASLVALQSRIAELEAESNRLSASEEALRELQLRYEAAQAAARAAEVALATARGEEATARLELQHARSEQRSLEGKQLQLAALERERLLNEELVRAFADIRNHLNSRLRPELSEIASRFLRDLTDGRYGELELTESFDVVVMDGAVPKQVISGGEEDLAQLSLRLAISQLIAERAGQDFSLLVLDEIFGSLDEIRRHNVVELLRGLTDRFEQVILITHIESVRDQLDRVIELLYDEETGATRVKAQPAPTLAAVGPDPYPLQTVSESQ